MSIYSEDAFVCKCPECGEYEALPVAEGSSLYLCNCGCVFDSESLEVE